MSDATAPVERWLPVPGYEDWYEVSDLGRVRSWQRKGPGSRRNDRPSLLRQAVGQTGYNEVALSSLGRLKTWRVHCLVAYAFLGDRPEGMEVAHADSDKSNNRLSNLRYATHEDNLTDGRCSPRSGPRRYVPSARRKLSVEDVLVIRSMSEGIPALALRFQVDRKTIRAIQQRLTYTDVA